MRGVSDKTFKAMKRTLTATVEASVVASARAAGAVVVRARGAKNAAERISAVFCNPDGGLLAHEVMVPILYISHSLQLQGCRPFTRYNLLSSSLSILKAASSNLAQVRQLK